MPHTIAHHTLTDALTSNRQVLTNLPTSYTDHEMLHGMEYSFGTFRCAVLAVLPPSFLCTCSLPEHGNRKILDLGSALLSNCYQSIKCITNIVLILDPSTAAWKKSKSPIPADSRTSLQTILPILLSLARISY